MPQNLCRPITSDEIDLYERDGVVCLRGLFDATWVGRLRGAVERSLAEQSPSALEAGAEGGRFHLNTFMWQRDDDFRALVFESPAAHIAQALMRTQTVRFYFDHLFVKEPGTRETTPWHHDLPYWPVSGDQVCSIWLALDPVTRASSGLEYVRGSHRFPNRYRPEAWGRNDPEALAKWRAAGLIDAGADGEAMPDIDGHRDRYEFASFDCEPGDCLVHHVLTIHGSSGNGSTTRRRALSTRWIGDDARYAPRAGTFRPLLDRSLTPGAPLASAKFPLVIGSDAAGEGSTAG